MTRNVVWSGHSCPLAFDFALRPNCLRKAKNRSKKSGQECPLYTCASGSELLLLRRLILRNGWRCGRSRRRALRFRLRWLYSRKHGGRSAFPCGINRQGDGGQHKYDRRPRGCPGKNGSRAARSESSLATLTAKGCRQIAALTTLQQHDRNQE
jgi:hypothetical protein